MPDYIAVAGSENITTESGETVMAPGEIYLIGREGLINKFGNELRTNIFRILPRKQWFYMNETTSSGSIRLTVQDFNGSIVGVIENKGLLELSPGGKFAYPMVSMESTRPLKILDFEGSLIFRIPHRFEYQVQAVSDSEVLVLEEKTLSMWDVVQGKKLWDRQIPRDNFFTDTAFRILYSDESGIIVARDMYGCYCFDISGSLLWYRDGLNGQRMINAVGLSDDGTTAIGVILPDGIQMKTLDKSGNERETLIFSFGPEVSFKGNWGFEIDVFSEVRLQRFLSREGSNSVHVTAIAIKENKQWITGVVEGLWFYLPASENAVLVGIRNQMTAIEGLSLEP
jgi:hypothetical protein